MPSDIQLWTWTPVFTSGFYLTLCLWKSLPGQYPGDRIPVGNGSALLLHFASPSPLLLLPLNIGFLVFVCHPQYDGLGRKWTCSSLLGRLLGESQGPIIKSVIHCWGPRSQKLHLGEGNIYSTLMTSKIGARGKEWFGELHPQG